MDCHDILYWPSPPPQCCGLIPSYLQKECHSCQPQLCFAHESHMTHDAWCDFGWQLYWGALYIRVPSPPLPLVLWVSSRQRLILLSLMGWQFYRWPLRYYCDLTQGLGGMNSGLTYLASRGNPCTLPLTASPQEVTFHLFPFHSIENLIALVLFLSTLCGCIRLNKSIDV